MPPKFIEWTGRELCKRGVVPTPLVLVLNKFRYDKIALVVNAKSKLRFVEINDYTEKVKLFYVYIY